MFRIFYSHAWTECSNFKCIASIFWVHFRPGDCSMKFCCVRKWNALEISQEIFTSDCQIRFANTIVRWSFITLYYVKLPDRSIKSVVGKRRKEILLLQFNALSLWLLTASAAIWKCCARKLTNAIGFFSPNWSVFQLQVKSQVNNNLEKQWFVCCVLRLVNWRIRKTVAIPVIFTISL